VLGYLSADIICSEKQTVLRERCSRKTASFEEQIMSKDKYPSIFSKSNGGYCVYYPSNIFRYTRSFENWGILRIFPSFSWGIFCHVTRLEQSCASEKTWWIIICIIGRSFLLVHFDKFCDFYWLQRIILQCLALNETGVFDVTCTVKVYMYPDIPYMYAHWYNGLPCLGL